MTNENANLFAALNDLDGAVSDQLVLLDTLEYVLDGLDRSAQEVKIGGPAAAVHFVGRYHHFARMLFLLLGQLQEQANRLQAISSQSFKAWEDVKAEVQA